MAKLKPGISQTKSDALIHGGKRANGGKREGAGRKPKAYTILKRRLIAELGEEAEKCFDFYIQVRNNPEEPTALRLEAARRIEERVFGKPMQPLGNDDTGKLVIEIVHESSIARP